ncbi:TPA: hypothetical protein N0F65_010051 [Lagenidium giganteum]|uniref:Uncharacterized protein n=1 Tax=Lagenidium giganteum TaxID=4803 RepID=A0AAV2ZEY3_9STRA|nr:TPA: hypothetical protein N0F65_010051 [Lagenidium giganteum]
MEAEVDGLDGRALKKPASKYQMGISDGTSVVDIERSASTATMRPVSSFLRPPSNGYERKNLGIDGNFGADIDVELELEATKIEEAAPVVAVGLASKDDKVPANDSDDENEMEASRKLSIELQLEMLRGKLSRRNKVIETIRRAYYQDIILVKEELHSRGLSATSFLNSEDRLSGVPSIDLRDALPLFAPAETVLRVHPCETCGGHLELVHGESSELLAARQEMLRAAKGEHQMRNVVHRLRTEAKDMEEVKDALQQRVKALVKENAYALEQLQAARKMERDQKATITSLRSKLQLSQCTQEEVDRLVAEIKDVKQNLVRSNHERDIFSASNNHLKEELGEVSKALHQVRVEKAQFESDFAYKLQEEIKKCKQLTEDLAATRTVLKDKISQNEGLQSSLTSLKEELANTLQRFEQTKRHLEDQLIEEEREREELQEQSLELRKANKKLQREMEAMKNSGGFLTHADAGHAHANHPGGVPPGEFKAMIRQKFDELQQQIEWANMRESDLAGLLWRQSQRAPPPPIRHKLSRMPSTTVVTRFIPTEAKSDGGQGDGSRHPNLGDYFRRRQGTTPRAKEADVTEEEPSSDRFESEVLGNLEVNEKNFELYHQEVTRLLGEMDELRERYQIQQKVAADMEKRHQVLLDRLEESKITIEGLTGSVNALKLRLNQDSAGAAEQIEEMLRQIDESKRDMEFEAEKGQVLMQFLKTVSDEVYRISENKALLTVIELERPHEDEAAQQPDESESVLTPDLVQKKRELRRRVLMDKAMKKFSHLSHNRAEVVLVEIERVVETATRLREDLDLAENKIDSDQLTMRQMEADMAKLKLTVEVGKNNLMRNEKALKTATEELKQAQLQSIDLERELSDLKEEHTFVQEDQQRLTMLLFDKTKAWEKEINTNDRCIRKIEMLEDRIAASQVEREQLAAKLKEIADREEYRLRTNTSVEIMAVPDFTESEMQTDQWKPQGLILRQRNGPERLPQRYMGKASIMIGCPELTRLPSPRATKSFASVNQESTATAMSAAEANEQVRRELLELTLYPGPKVGGRQIKTSYASSRPRTLSRLHLSADGIVQQYVGPSPRKAFEEDARDATRPFTSN